MKKIPLSAFLVPLCALPARSQLISGSVLNYSELALPHRVGDSGNHVTISWSVANANRGSGYFYGSSYNGDTDVAIATGVTDIRQITNASIYTFTDSFASSVYDAAYPDHNGIGTFVVLRNNFSRYYGVVRVDDIHPLEFESAGLDATWWFQRNGSANFTGPVELSPIPEPAHTAIAAVAALLSLVIIRQRSWVIALLGS
jgi:hypothetical protein